MANVSTEGSLQISGADISSYDASAADVQTDWVNASGDWLGILVEATISGGSSPTLDCQLQFTRDGGTTVHDFPADNNSGTQAALTQMTSTATGKECRFWLNPFPGGASYQWRVNFNQGGTVSVMTIVEARHFSRKTMEN